MGKGQKVVNRLALEEWLKDYHWMINDIAKAREISRNTISTGYKGAKTAQYGIEATLPKASGETGDPVSFEAVRRANSFSRIIRYEGKVREIQERSKLVKGEREIYVLNRILDGDSMRKIGINMRLSEATIRRVKERILDMMLGKAVAKVELVAKVECDEKLQSSISQNV